MYMLVVDALYKCISILFYTSEADHLHGLATNGFMVIHTITIHQAKLKHKKETVRKTEEIHWEQTVPKKTMRGIAGCV